MDLPIKFPSDEEVIREEVARFRALSPEERMDSIRDLLGTGSFLMRISDKKEIMRKCILEQENLARQAVKEFLTRHAG